jgi:quercetin dioxygenase-like cupin family protein
MGNGSKLERTLARAGTVLLVYVAIGSSVGAAPAAAQADGYSRASSGTRELVLGGGTTIKLLLEASNLGSSEIEVAEITFPPGTNPVSGHAHGSIEIFYVLEGVLGHVVNEVEHRLEPGMVGVVKPGDSVMHRVLSEGSVRALVLWVPGGEAARIAPLDRWRRLDDGRRGGGR